MNDAEMDAVFQALASATRRRILDLLKEMPGCSVNDVCKYFETSRIGIMKHLRVLEEAELIISLKSGRTRQLYFNAVPIQLVYDRWTTEYSKFWASQVTDLKFQLEGKRPDREQDTLSNRSDQPYDHPGISRHDRSAD